MREKVFITGIAGFLGSHLADRLLKEGYQVSGCDNLLGGYRNNVPANAEFHENDAQDFEAMKKLLHGMDVIYHCAAAPHEGLSMFSPILINKHTYSSTVAVVSAAVTNEVKRVVFCSSMARYGSNRGVDGDVFTEDMTAKPVDPYGIAKYASELFLGTMAKAYGFEYVIAVPHNIYGPRQKYDDPYRNVVSIMTNLMLLGRQPIIYGDGEQKRSFTYIADAIEPLIKMGFQQNLNGHVINIGPDEEFVTINHVARTIADILQFPLDPQYVPERPLEVKYASCSADKSRTLLGYATTTPFRVGVEQIVSWIREHGPKPFIYHLPLEIINEKTPQTWKNKLF